MQFISSANRTSRRAASDGDGDGDGDNVSLIPAQICRMVFVFVIVSQTSAEDDNGDFVPRAWSLL